ncbi:MAG TPA: twin-arginine translocase TatA/TatE family subunit [Thermoanaerobaculia bacterium]
MEWVIVLIVVVILFLGGGKKIPEFAQSLGRARGEFERGRMEVERDMALDREKTGSVAGGSSRSSSHGRFCTKCGTPASSDAVFCGKCGSALPKAA